MCPYKKWYFPQDTQINLNNEVEILGFNLELQDRLVNFFSLYIILQIKFLNLIFWRI